MDIFREKDEIDKEKYFNVKYKLKAKKGKTLRDVAWCLAVGQSIGNPNIRSNWETTELVENHCAKIIDNESKLLKENEAIVEIAFPCANIDIETDGITQLLVQIMGGQLDIDLIEVCHILDITFPQSIKKSFLKPKYGITGIRKYTNVYNKPLLGGIVKPKVGISPDVLLEVIKEMVEGGVNFIKEDEILSNPRHCRMEERLPPIVEYLDGKDVIYAVCVNSDYPHVIDRVKKVYELGGNAVHVNFWNGLGVYNTIRKLNLPLFLFFQKSGDSILTNPEHNHHIEWNVLCKLAGLMGVDFIHAGMWGGYMSNNEVELRETLSILRTYNVMPSLSCGMHPGLIDAVTSRFGVDYMANIGGAIHGHPSGTKAGTMALYQAINKNYGKEYNEAIEKWGRVK